MRAYFPFILLMLAVAGCQKPEPQKPPNFLFVLIDTLRADHVGTLGYNQPTTPFIDSLAADGRVFENALSQAPWTGASMASLWTSRYPSESGAYVLPDSDGRVWLGKTSSTKLNEELPTVAELLSEFGYDTIAVVTNSYAGEHFDLLRGYGVTRSGFANAAKATDKAIAELDARTENGSDQPFFLYVHYIDPHEPTFPPESYRSLFPSRDGEPHERRHERWAYGREVDPEDADFKSFRDHKINLYDASIRFVDSQIERLSDELERRGLLDSTVFIIASDHGEEFWDHRQFELETHLDPRGSSGVGHGHSLFNQLIHVPLILTGPGITRARVAAPVRNLDIAPTILTLAGVDVADRGFRGTSLLETAEELSRLRLDRFSESLAYGVEAQSLTRDGWKFIRYRETKTGKTEFLFDVSIDKSESREISNQNAAKVAEMRSAVDSILAGMERTRSSDATIDEETRNQLQALGYIDPTNSPESEILEARIDFSEGPGSDTQLISGFYQHEDRFRWISGSARAILGRPQAANSWRIRGWVDLASHGLEKLGLAITLDGKEPSVHEVATSGPFLIEGALPESDGDNVALDLTCDHEFVPAERREMSSRDSRRLCVIIYQIEVF
ncbi:MAG: hypothetical protein CL933_01935 [Deltaproteobacteria bacterium]|nr:hypothetical protein [Deltaproteobacteria bacterium]